jgi:hypothetical protein
MAQAPGGWMGESIPESRKIDAKKFEMIEA